MTWEQIGLFADIVQRRQIEVLNLTLTPLVTATSGKRWKGYTSKRKRLVKGVPKATSDAKLLGALGMLGLHVGVEKLPPKSGNEGE